MHPLGMPCSCLEFSAWPLSAWFKCAHRSAGAAVQVWYSHGSAGRAHACLQAQHCPAHVEVQHLCHLCSSSNFKPYTLNKPCLTPVQALSAPPLCAGVLRASHVSRYPIIAARPNTQGIFLTSHGLAVLRLARVGTTAPAAPSTAVTAAAPLVDDVACEGLNGSRLVAAAWSVESQEAVAAPRGFALTHEGDLVTLSVGSGSRGPCKVSCC